MLKYKSLIITVVLALGLMTGGIAGAARLSQSKSEEFAGDGYVLAVAETEGGLEADPIYFTGGTHYQSSYPDNAVFKDVRGTKYEVGKDSFLMYADGSVSSLSSGVVVNLDDVNGGLVNHYALSSGTVMASSGNTYTVDSNGTPLTFSSFLWKVSDSRYLIYSDNLAVQTFGGNNGDFSGMVQIDYLEDGVIRLTSETAVWQGVAAGATATTSDGVTLSFADKTLLDSDGAARMTLGEILLDADGNIHVQSALDWVPPIFEFEVIDGENGVNGIAGEDGEAGEAGSQGEAGMQGDEGEEGEAGSDGAAGEEGEEGEEGEAGEDGEAGANGSNGNDGENGSNGKTGTIPQNDSQTQATFTLTSFNVDGGSVSGTISVIDDDGVLSEPGSIYLVNVSTGAIIEVLVDGDTVESFADGDELSFEADNLSPDTQYRLIVKSAYILNSTEGEKDYINRTFYTDTSGVFLELDYATTSGFYATLTTKDYATATVATISILNSSGEEIYTTEAHLSAGEQEIEIDLTESGLTVSDVANREYEVRMKLSGGGNDEDETLTTQSWTTLKQTPTLGAATFNVNNSGYFEMGVEVVSDPDSAISYYNYTIYDDSGNAVKTVSNISDNSNVPLYIETGVIDTGEYYYAVATAYYYDNEKYVELSSTRSDSARIVDEGNSLVWFEHYGTATDEQGNLIETDTYYRYAELRGTLYIEKKNVSSIDTSKELTVLLESTSSADYSYSMQVSFGTYDTNETTLSVPVDYKGLKSDTTYRIAVWGWVTTTVDGGDTQETYT
ncbi:MAG: hypothetical protein LIO81_06525, partial [Clostridiales bacterium]|nr:hypothetical protein [Clostridiales bacterium]